MIAGCKELGGVCGTDGREIALVMVAGSILGPTCDLEQSAETRVNY